MSRRRTAVAVPLVVAVLLAGWLLWVRAEPGRTGGYCASAASEFMAVIERSSGGSSRDLGVAPDGPAILAAARTLDVAPFQVDTPPEVRADVDLLAGSRSGSEGPGAGDDAAAEVQAAWARVLVDYYERCR